MRAVHFNEIKDKVSALRVAVGLAALPSPTGDWPLDTTKRIRAQHMTDLRGWVSQYEADVAAVNAGYRARAIYRYDEGGAAANAVGRRTTMLDGSGRTAWAYDLYGRTASCTRTTDGQGYATGYAYDAFDRVVTMAYPDDGSGETLSYAYAANTLLGQLSSSLGVALVSGVNYNALNLPTGFLLGGGAQATETRTYWGANLDAAGAPYGSLRSVKLQPGANPALVDRTMAYDPMGNPTSILDAVNNETIAYTYDDLDRLTGAGDPVNESYQYGQTGNMTQRNGLALTYDPGHPHAVSAYNGTSYAYDAAGNLTSRAPTGAPAVGLQYDQQNRLSKLSRSDIGTICRYAYDGDGGRTKRLDKNGAIHYVGKHFERNVGVGDGTTLVTKYYYATVGSLSRLVAFRYAGNLRWVGVDHLGGTIRTADASFNPLDQARYKPYGEDRDPATNLQTDRKFTGQTQDAESGLYFFGARYYDPAIGHFVQPDTVVPSGKDPQSLNRYSYSRNNPLRFTDPTGHVTFDEANNDLPTQTDGTDAYSMGTDATSPAVTDSSGTGYGAPATDGGSTTSSASGSGVDIAADIPAPPPSFTFTEVNQDLGSSVGDVPPAGVDQRFWDENAGNAAPVVMGPAAGLPNDCGYTPPSYAPNSASGYVMQAPASTPATEQRLPSDLISGMLVVGEKASESVAHTAASEGNASFAASAAGAARSFSVAGPFTDLAMTYAENKTQPGFDNRAAAIALGGMKFPRSRGHLSAWG